MASDKSLIVENISVQRGAQQRLSKVNFSLPHGSITCLVGPNGAGKSTLIKCIAGDIEPTAGRIAFCSKTINDLPLSERAKIMAVLPQHSSLNFPFTVEEVVALGRMPHASGTKIDKSIIDDICSVLELHSLRARRYPELSGGEKQRVQIARVLAQIWPYENDTNSSNRLILLDEPLAALDIAHKKALINVLSMLAKKGCTIIMVVHDFSDVSIYSDYVLLLSQSRQIALGKPQDVLTAPLLVDVFGVAMDVIINPMNKKTHVVLS